MTGEPYGSPMALLTKRVEVLEAALDAQAQAILKLMRRSDPTSKDHEWGEIDIDHPPHCSCVTWTDWETGLPGRKHNRFCRFPHRA